MREYTDGFFDYIERGSRSSAQCFAGILLPVLKPKSILDVGCGRGAWLKEWRSAGVESLHGVDGPYVQRNRLLVEADEFTPKDLSKPFDLGRRFDLVTSLEVAEHLPPQSSEIFIDSLICHADHVLFSAATVGQGGEYHINERPLRYWQGVFAERDYIAFDYIRPRLGPNDAVEPWYRYNSVLYVRQSAVSSLAPEIAATAVKNGDLQETGSPLWKLRRACVGYLPIKTVTAIAQWNARRKVKAFNRAIA